MVQKPSFPLFVLVWHVVKKKKKVICVLRRLEWNNFHTAVRVDV